MNIKTDKYEINAEAITQGGIAMSKYTIKITYQGGRQNHLACCLSKLDEAINPTVRAGWATREEACEHLYAAMYDIIDSEDGCDMVAKSTAPKAYWVLSGEGERGTWHRIITTPLGIKQHLTKERCGGDRWAIAITDLYETKYNEVCGVIVGGAGYPSMVPDEARADIGEANDVHAKYVNLCHAFILREGWATEDGVTATVEAVED